MVTISRGRVLTSTSPLTFIAQVRGVVTPVVSLAYAILDASTDDLKLAPVQVFPGSGLHAVDLLADRIRPGHYAATGWTVPSTGPGSSGTMLVRWVYTLSGGFQGTVEQEFEVLASAPDTFRGPKYALVSDFREEGITSASVSDSRLLLSIIRASELIERYTGRFFEPRYLELPVNGTGSPMIMLDVPIIGLSDLAFETGPVHISELFIDSDLWRVYNRHLDGLVSPDDRDSPKIEMLSSGDDYAAGGLSFSRLIFPRGQKNVTVRGFFGYTEADGSPFGRTPSLLRHACKLLTMRESAKLSQVSTREDAQRRARIIEERTRDQSYKLAADPRQAVATITGDPEVDIILRSFCRPPAMGAA